MLGEYACTGPCGGKRLIADKFSKSSLTNHKLHNKPLRCKQCIAEAQKQEQGVSATGVEDAKVSVESSESTNSSGDPGGECSTVHPCSACSKSLPASSFNRNQLNKGEGKQRCKECVQIAEMAAATAVEEGKATKLAQAEERLRLAEAASPKNTAEVLAAASALAALEAQAVTGMTPATRRGGGGKGGGGGRGRGRDRGGGSCWVRR